jgi:hypothetical protein
MAKQVPDCGQLTPLKELVDGIKLLHWLVHVPPDGMSVIVFPTRPTAVHTPTVWSKGGRPISFGWQLIALRRYTLPLTESVFQIEAVSPPVNTSFFGPTA